MMPSTIQIVTAFDAAMETALSIDVIMGLPEVGRVPMTYPLGAVLFDTDDYGTSRQGQQRVAIGREQPQKNMLTVQLYLFASNEFNLLTLVDSLRTVKAASTGFHVSGTPVTVRFGETRRTQVFESDKIIENTVATTVTFSF
jgi:hypothetical protein